VAAVAAIPSGPVAGEIPTGTPVNRILTIAHRGAHQSVPEDTLPAIEKAVELGFDYVELDVRFTSDGVPVLMHDATVNRTTDGHGLVRDMTLAEIKRLDAAGAPEWRGSFCDLRVPTLEEALSIMKGRASAYVNQKDPPRLVEIHLLRKYGFYPGHAVVAGRNEQVLAFRELAPKADLLLNIRDIDDIPAVLASVPRLKGFTTRGSIVTRELVEAAHADGVLVFTNALGPDDTASEMQRVIAAGVDAIQTNQPDVLLRLLGEMDKEWRSGNAQEVGRLTGPQGQ
jgi:glycerophosphoryl diester phosphodiesterase